MPIHTFETTCTVPGDEYYFIQEKLKKKDAFTVTNKNYIEISIYNKQRQMIKEEIYQKTGDSVIQFNKIQSR